MPDPKQMAGIPRPVDDLPAGSVSVRLIRGQLSNNIANHPVELHVGGKVLTVRTDESGRAQFDKLAPGASVKAVAVVDGERLESQEFPAPAQGGIRLMLVATDTSAGPATEPNAEAVAGQVTLGGDTRIVIEPGDDTLNLYYLLDIVNSSRVPVNPAAPFTFDMPSGATSTGLLQGSSPQASVKGSRVQVAGPFAPGRTLVQVGSTLPSKSGSVGVTQRFPAPLERLTVLAKKVGDLKLESPQLERQQDFASQGETIVAAAGGSVAAGQPIVLAITGLPHHSAVPRYIALSLAAAIVLVGLWAAWPREGAPAQEGERKRLLTRREKLFNELVRLENDRRNGRGDATRYASRRQELIASLEHLYGALDDSDDRAGAAA
jgi:hypothetical protein